MNTFARLPFVVFAVALHWLSGRRWKWSDQCNGRWRWGRGERLWRERHLGPIRLFQVPGFRKD